MGPVRIKKIKRIISEEIHYIINYFNWRIKRRSFPQGNNRMIHVGCGTIDYPGFINVDIIPLSHIHYIANAESLKMFKKESVDLIYMSHCLEHISHLNIDMVLSEYYKLLKVGGVLRLSVPDFSQIVKIYSETEDLDSLLTVLFGGQDYDFNYHFSIFDEKFLRTKLLQAGFSLVNLWEYGGGPYKDLPDWSGRKIKVGEKEYLISLNIEGIKYKKY
jgi:SAM-dependent methyltransferase